VFAAGIQRLIILLLEGSVIRTGGSIHVSAFVLLPVVMRVGDV